MLKWMKWFAPKEPQPIMLPPPPALNIDDIRTRLTDRGWVVREIPMKSGQRVASWKVIAQKGDKSVSYSGVELEETLRVVAKLVGAIANGR